MHKTKQREQMIRAMESLAELSALPFHRVGDAILMGNLDTIQRKLDSYPDDITGLESFVNHVHLEDTLSNLLQTSGEERAILFRIGISIIKTWSERIKYLLDDREVLFYLGGKDTVSLRFHIDRKDGQGWVDLSDVEFLKREQLSVFRVNRSGITAILNDS